MASMTDHLTALRIFVRVAHTGSFSQAAREHKLSQPTTSRMISDLEEHLGVTLFTRTTRAVALTQIGAEYLTRVQPILDALAEADHGIRGTGELRGVLRVSVASIIASRVILPRLKSFMAQHPKLDIHLATEDRRQDLIIEGIDVALRFGKLADSSALARRIGAWPLVMAGSPAYLQEHGVPATPAELATHSFVVAGPVAAKTLILRKEGREVSVVVNGNLTINGTDSAVAAGREGVGLVVASTPALIGEIDQGTLVPILSDWDMGEIEGYALFSSGQTPKPAARAFVEFMIDVMQDF
jgi:DNA-binding transcriptional LysR family regulator